ncbi:MAG: hypothetical protein IJ530_16150 [Treponema sp.]|uniref:hypothetical protein n=1 Tax=Treponema sp. TaxID=166 RepID=UPI0025E94850|nr:hypothetical protein [Treponema sp.]MBQ8679332.1 hypothetical protein [Treponema sp.]MBQ8681264.1 hypothetical protein [Treponema sp.]
MQYRRKETVEAIQWNGSNQAEIKAMAGQFAMFDYADTNHDGKTFDAVLKVKTSEKIIPAQIGDYVVRGEKGDFFISQKTAFEALYEPL